MPTIPSPQSRPPHYITPPLTVILTVILLVFFFIGFFTLYFCKCFLDTMMHAWRLHHGGDPAEDENALRQSEPPPVNPGLDLHIINSFPTFPYSSVKDLREEKYGLECAICLLEFDGDHVLRLLNICYHVFHQECIDLWFESHKTCPVCRRDLDPPPQPENNVINLSNVDEMIIDVIQETSDDEDHDHNHQTTTPIDTWPSSGGGGGQSSSNMKKEQNLPEKFSRSHSTGHSIVRNKPEEEDKYTLRLPEHVKIKVTRGHRSQTESCVSFAEVVRNRGYDHRRFGEVSGQTPATKS